VAAGVDALFVETHPNPDDAPCDAACQLDFAALEALVAEVTAIRAALDG
jgi:2-dehydro-3-deoxyphosphooctonate aldolase (KDO 8-P synthase)